MILSIPSFMCDEPTLEPHKWMYGCGDYKNFKNSKTFLDTIKCIIKSQCLQKWWSVLFQETSLKPWFWTYNPFTLHCVPLLHIRKSKATYNSSAQIKNYYMLQITIPFLCICSFLLLELCNCLITETNFSIVS